MSTNDEWIETESTLERGPWGESIEYQYAETTDPRFLAIIQRDTDWGIEQAFDGDGILPIYYRGWLANGRLQHVGGDDDDIVAEAWGEAYRSTPGHLVNTYYGSQWRDKVSAEDFADRFVRIFHGAHVTHVDGSHGHDRDGEYIIFDTPAHREHIGDDPANTSQEAVDAEADELVKVLEGDVWGIGWAVNEGRRLDDEPIDLNDGNWEIEIDRWGFIGVEYAQSEALVQPYPEAQPMLDLERGQEYSDRMADSAADGWGRS